MSDVPRSESDLLFSRLALKLLQQGRKYSGSRCHLSKLGTDTAGAGLREQGRKVVMRLSGLKWWPLSRDLTVFAETLEKEAAGAGGRRAGDSRVPS